MVFFAKLARSADLVSGMAERTGLDLTEPGHAMAFKQMVFACAGCTDQDGCTGLQAANDSLDRPPAYCRNAARFAAE